MKTTKLNSSFIVMETLYFSPKNELPIVGEIARTYPSRY